MRLAWAFGVGMCGQAFAQWQQLHPYVAYWGAAQPSQGGTIMIGPGVGVHLLNLYYSPSTGGGYQLYRTESDWEDESTFLFDSGFGPGRLASGMVNSRGGKIYYQQGNQGIYQIHWINDLTGQASIDHDGTYYSAPLVLGAVNDTLCFAAYTRPDGPLFAIRVESGSATVCDTIAQGYWYPRHLDMISAQAGAMVLWHSPAYSKVLTTQDSGSTWQEVLIDSTHVIRWVEWSDDSTLWAGGDGGSLRRSSDRGVSWEVIAVPYSGDFTAMDSYSSDSLWVGGGDGVVMVTGNGGEVWESRPVVDATVTRIQLFDGAVYAYARDPDDPSGDLLYRWREVPDDLSRVGSGSWWSFLDQGILLRPYADEAITQLALYDMSGRTVNASSSGLMVNMSHLPAGLYIMALESNKRTERGKILWLSADR